MHHILFLLLIFFINPAAADETPWSEKKLGKAIIHADKAAARVRTAYFLSREYLGQGHETTMTNRMLYYKILIAQKAYGKAIPLVLENIAIVKKDDELKYKLHHYLTQLFSLYGLTEQLAKQEDALLELLELNEKLLSSEKKSAN